MTKTLFAGVRAADVKPFASQMSSSGGVLRFPAAVPTAVGLLLIGLICITGCEDLPPQISIEGQYAELSPMFLGSGSVFLTVRNAGGRDELVGAAAEPQRTIVELHDMRDRRMVKVPRLAVPGHGALELKPGGRHIMLFNMPRAIGAGSEITLLLRFEKSGEVRLPVKFVESSRR